MRSLYKSFRSDTFTRHMNEMQFKVSDRELLKIIIEIYIKSNRSGTKFLSKDEDDHMENHHIHSRKQPLFF